MLKLRNETVCIVDGQNISYSNAAEDEPQTMSVFGITLHVLSQGNRFDLTTRQPKNGPPEKVEQELAAMQS